MIEIQLKKIWEELIDNENIDNNGKIFSSKVKFEDKDLISFVKYVEYLLKDILSHEKQIEIPNYLKPFVERHLTTWIQSAILALNMEEGKNYIIDVDKTATKLDKYPNIIIVDCDTGVDQTNSQWNECLHQFLQLKHQCKTSLLSLKAIFISNITFFNMYKHIYGLSGTLGSQSEREFLQLAYDVDFLIVPVALRSKFKEYQPILCTNRVEWKAKIIEKAIEICKQRSVLIICETIKDVEQIHQSFKLQTMNDFNLNNIFIYKRSYEKSSIEHENLDIGKIIISTNLAGRATNINITDQLNINGGLHVILTYLPDNYRIEQQAFGRTARKGQNGSGQLIFFDQFNSKTNEIDSLLQIIDLKNERDYNELCRVGDIRHYYETSIQFQEQLFHRFHKAYSQLKEKLERQWETSDDIKDIILKSVLNKWTFWLDEIEISMNNKIQIVELLEPFIKQLDNIMSFEDSIKQLVTEPTQLIKLGKCYAKTKKYIQAFELFDKVIENEPKFCQAAHYYKAHCIVKHTELLTEDDKCNFNRSLDYVELLFQNHIDKLTQRSSIINQLSIINEKQSTISFVKINSYQIQNENICRLYSNFIQTIHNIRGHSVTHDTIFSIDINRELAFHIYKKLFNSDKNILIKKKLNKNFNKNKLEMICMDYRLDFNDMENYLKNEEFFNEEKLRKYIEKIKIPNREQFWKLMIEKEIITNVEHLILININQIFDKNTKLKEFMDKFEKQLKPIDQLKPNDKSIIFFEEIKFDKENIKYIFKPIDNNDYQNLEEQKFILLNQMATINIDKLRNISIGIFESITLNHFNKINDLNIDDQQQIYDKLVEQNIIDKETGILLTDDFQKLNLGKYQIYVQNINSLIKYQCLYKLQILELIKQFDSKDFNKINLTLSHHLHQELLYDLQSSLIIQPIYYNYKVINVSIFEQVCLKDYSKKLEQLINETCDCEEKKICKSVSKSLQNTIGKLNYLSQPDSYLNDIDQNFDETDKFEHTQEIDIFTINGLDHTIDIEEKKWSWQMLKNTAFIFILGFAQIAAGVVLELYSMGIGTHIASALISEGLSDISYAFFAAKSGYFNWNNYLVHKIQSVMLSIATMGIAAVITKGIRYSRFGSKVVGNTGNVKSLSGNELIKATENSRMPGVTNNLHKKVVCRIGLKITEGIAFGLSSAVISLLSDKLLKGYSGRIVEELFSQIRDSIEAKKNEIQQSLKIIYQRYGRHLTEKWLIEIEESINSDTWYETIAHITTTIVNVVVGGVSEALHKMNQAGHSSTMVEIMSIFMTVYNKVKQYQPYLTAIKKVFFDTKRLIENKIKILKEKAQQCQNENQINKEEIINENDLNNFIEKTTEQWRQTLENKIDTDIRTIIIEPMLNQGTKILLKKLGKAIRNYHQRRKNNLLWKKFQDTKNKYEKDKENRIRNQDENSVNTSDFLKELNDQYNQNLLILMANTTDPNLVASIIDEGGPMDYSCIRAIANILNEPIKINNADGTTFPDLICPDGLDRNNIQDANCISVELIRGDGVNTFGHFVVSGQTDRNEIDNNYDNNCLIYAIAGAANINSSNVNEFRRRIANEIKTNPQIGDIIRNGYHRYYISQLGFGGQRESSVDQLKKASISEKDSNRYLVGVVSKHGNRKDYGTTCLSKRNVRESEHLLPRALVQRLCEVMCIRYLIEKTIKPELKGNQEEEKKLFDYFRKKIDENDKPIIKELDKFMIKSKEMLAMCIPYSAHHNAEKTWTSFKSSFPEFWKEAEGYIDAYKSMDDNQNDNLFNLLISQYDYLLKNDQQYPRMRSGIAIYLELSEKRGYINRNQRIELLNKWNLPYRISTDQSHEIPMDHQNHELLENVLNTASSMEPPKFERKRRKLAP